MDMGSAPTRWPLNRGSGRGLGMAWRAERVPGTHASSGGVEEVECDPGEATILLVE